jgi:PAS domain-containing protein
MTMSELRIENPSHRGQALGSLAPVWRMATRLRILFADRQAEAAFGRLSDAALADIGMERFTIRDGFDDLGRSAIWPPAAVIGFRRRLPDGE